jgi:hypothetical protein
MCVTRKNSIVIIFALIFFVFLQYFSIYHPTQTFLPYPVQANTRTSFEKLELAESIIMQYPFGAPQTGFGQETTLHKMDGKASLPLLVVVFTLLIGGGTFYMIRDWIGVKRSTIKS